MLPECYWKSLVWQCVIGDTFAAQRCTVAANTHTASDISVTCSNCLGCHTMHDNSTRLGKILLWQNTALARHRSLGDDLDNATGVLQANAAEADVQAWHEGLREYPDLSLEPHLRRQQFRARNQEIRGRVLARCGGLQMLHLAENQVRHRVSTTDTAVIANSSALGHAWSTSDYIHSVLKPGNGQSAMRPIDMCMIMTLLYMQGQLCCTPHSDSCKGKSVSNITVCHDEWLP